MGGVVLDRLNPHHVVLPADRGRGCPGCAGPGWGVAATLSVAVLCPDGGTRADLKPSAYALVVGNIGKEVRRIEVLPVPEPTPQPASPERPEPQREPARAR